jgi:hypothetical protein
VVKNAVYKMLARAFMPDVAKSMEREGTFDLADNDGGVDDSLPHVVIEDRGSDVTIFSFAGMAVLFAGLPVFEFRKLLKHNGSDFNLVFFRDVRRFAYMLTPDGELGGAEFYKSEVQRIMKELGSTYNVSIGASVGGAAAFQLAMDCGMDQVITFGPVLSSNSYTGIRQQVSHLGDLPKLVREPQAYAEVALMTLGAAVILRKVEKRLGKGSWVEVSDNYIDYGAGRPRATIFHGARCRPDRRTASHLAHLDEVKVVPVETGRHNCAAILKARGEMGDIILREIEDGMAGRAHKSTDDQPQPQQA